PRYMGQLAVGEHVLRDEVARAAADAAVVDVGRGDAVLERQAAGLEQAVDDAEVFGQVLQADVLEHADRADAVVDPGAGNVPVVGELDLDAILEAGLANALAREIELVL